MSSNTIISFRPANVIRRLPWRLDSQAASGFLLILGTFGLVGWLYLTQASAVTATSYRIDELRLELDQINNQNATLRLEIAELEALPRIEQRARALGFAGWLGSSSDRDKAMERLEAACSRDASLLHPLEVTFLTAALVGHKYALGDIDGSGLNRAP